MSFVSEVVVQKDLENGFTIKLNDTTFIFPPHFDEQVNIVSLLKISLQSNFHSFFLHLLI
jgi:hypothetical protein